MEQKKIAVIVRDRQSEAFRMSVGLTVLDDKIDIYLIKPLMDDTKTLQELQGATELGLDVYSIFSDNRFKKITIEDMSERLLEYDHRICY